MLVLMNYNEFKRRLKALGAEIESHRGKGSHMRISLGDRFTFSPDHGRKEVAKGTFRAICRQLGIDPNTI
ncbi:MAG: MRNA interferase [Magnetococcales bacterium]|nr:MRNA interferase [Magnetococcales bacterium]